MQKVKQSKTNFSDLRGYYSAIARNCGCSVKYVFLVANGLREPKTDRAQKYHAVIAECERVKRALRPKRVEQ